MSGDSQITISGCSTRRYLVRAIYEWAIDNNFTPQILVFTEIDGVNVPTQYVKDERIVLNIHPEAVQSLDLGDEHVFFSARFAGKAYEITVPLTAISAIFARENGEGVVFQEGAHSVLPPPTTLTDSVDKNAKTMPEDKKKSSHLKLV